MIIMHCTVVRVYRTVIIYQEAIQPYTVDTIQRAYFSPECMGFNALTHCSDSHLHSCMTH